MMTSTPVGNGSVCTYPGGMLSTALPPMLILEFVLGALGNGIALWVFCFHLKPWKTSTVFLFNLTLADFLLIIILPFRTSYYLRNKHWVYGDVFCRISLFMLAMNRGGSILFLTAVAVDRYFKVVHPHHPINSMAISRASIAACVLWAFAILMTVYLLTESHLIDMENSTQCDSFTIDLSSVSGSMWHNALFFLEFIVPLGIIVYCSLSIIWQLKDRQLDKHNKIKKAVRFIGVVVVVFVICFLPSNVTQLVIWAKMGQKIKSCDAYESLDRAFYITISLTYLNSMLDPVVYYFSNPTFKRIYRAVVNNILRKKKEKKREADEKTRPTLRETTDSQTLSHM
ncbi:hydroxycarboxylic acid receptor 3-like [Amia ocellicauda]|uniref:hydroxycarboxylic acid receptor 3-like n=1 Tax=Amia ocellicauda TaxID=2972642 RepID=UPI003464C50F